MTVATTLACARCGGPTRAGALTPEMERWAGLVRPVCASCTAASDAEQQQREAAIEARRRAHDRARRLRHVGVPPNLVGYGFADVDMPEGLDEGLELASAWAHKKLRGVGLVGPVGTGKTWLGAAAANEVCKRTQAYWYSAPVLIARLQGEFGSELQKKAVMVQTGTCPLVLDDLDKAPGTEFAATQLFVAIDARCDGGGQLLVTTNLRSSELKKRWPQPFGEAMVDRMKMLTWARVDGPSKRGTGRRLA